MEIIGIVVLFFALALIFMKRDAFKKGSSKDDILDDIIDSDDE